ncbi:MAG: 3-phosphoshikimate 1-carboxyvinyltransferase [bacterium]|nr:3-phosphoshikimate 1-carboxyvinyltransferase [bacterium]
MRIQPARRISGTLRLPGDKSLSHRHLLRAALVEGRSGLIGLPDGQDVGASLDAVQALGVRVERTGDHILLDSPGRGGWRAPGVIDCGNSGTTARLLMGLLAGSPFPVELRGDESLSRRPMERVARPLRLMGAEIELQRDGLPLRLRGGSLRGLSYELPVPSAQLKSAVVLAALQAEGESRIREPLPSRDHTERLLGLTSEMVACTSNGRTSAVREWIVSSRDMPRQPWSEVRLPADPSTAAFFVAAMLLMEEGELLIPDLLVNPFRRQYLDELMEWGAAIDLEEIPGEGFCGPAFCGAQGCHPGEQCPIAEPVAHLRVRAGLPLSARRVGGPLIPRLLDEIPVLAAVAMATDEPFVVEDAGELRHKESDRISGVCRMLAAFGGQVEERADGFILQPPERIRAGRFDARGDHRMAMAAAVLALAADDESVIEGGEAVNSSFPAFLETLRRLVG